MTDTSFIAVEWGTMRWRARLLTAAGETLDERREEVALSSLEATGIARTIASWAEAWPEAAARGMILSGMIGSAMGIREVPRLPCPATVEVIVQGAVAATVDDQSVLLLPGLSCNSRFDVADVMRGEEVAAMAVAARSPRATLLSVPGMHGKWIRLQDGGVQDFHTSMTIDLLRAIGSATIVAPLLRDPPVIGAAFHRGVAAGVGGSGLARLIFSARAAVQSGDLAAADAASFITGLLIGSDVADGLADPAIPHLVTGDPAVAPLFVAAIEQCGGRVTLLDDAAVTASGFGMLAAALIRGGRLRHD